MSRRRAVLAALTVGLAALPGACGGGEPTLRTIMVRIEKDQLALEGLLANHTVTPEMRDRVMSLERLSNDPSFAAYVDHWSFRGDKAEFESLRAFYLQKLADLSAATDAGDAGAFVGAYAGVRMACDVCHQKFRPDFR